MPNGKGFDSKDEKFQPAKLSDRERDGQGNGNWIELNNGNTYGMGNKFDKADKVTNAGGSYQDFESPDPKEYGNFSEKNSSISRLDMVGKSRSNCGTAYNGRPIPETYKPATSNGVPDANAVQYKNDVKDRNA